MKQWTISKLLLVCSVVALTGCATGVRPLYHWEGYQRQLYEHLKGDGTSPSEQLTVMQAQAEKARATGASLPPGFRAHLGMIQLRLGQYDEARRMFTLEKDTFPESKQYMDFVLKSMDPKKS